MGVGTTATRPGPATCFTPSMGPFEFVFDNFIDLFLRAEMFVNGGAAFEIVVGEGHAARMKVAREGRLWDLL